MIYRVFSRQPDSNSIHYKIIVIKKPRFASQATDINCAKEQCLAKPSNLMAYEYKIRGYYRGCKNQNYELHKTAHHVEVYDPQCRFHVSVQMHIPLNINQRISSSNVIGHTLVVAIIVIIRARNQIFLRAPFTQTGSVV